MPLSIGRLVPPIAHADIINDSVATVRRQCRIGVANLKLDFAGGFEQTPPRIDQKINLFFGLFERKRAIDQNSLVYFVQSRALPCATGDSVAT